MTRKDQREFHLMGGLGAATVGAFLVLLSFHTPPAIPAAVCCPIGAPCAQPLPLILRAPNSSYPTQTGGTFNLTVVAADTNLTAGDLQFRPMTSGTLVWNQSLTLAVYDTAGSIVANFNASRSEWRGEAAANSPTASDPYAGWSSGTDALIENGFNFSFTLAPTYEVYGYGFFGCASGMVLVEYPSD